MAKSVNRDDQNSVTNRCIWIWELKLKCMFWILEIETLNTLEFQAFGLELTCGALATLKKLIQNTLIEKLQTKIEVVCDEFNWCISSSSWHRSICSWILQPGDSSTSKSNLFCQFNFVQWCSEISSALNCNRR